MEKNEHIKEHELSSLKQQVEEAGIDTSSWGVGAAKTLEYLHREIQDGETVLVTEGGKLLRKLVVGAADVRYRDQDGRVFRLREDRQE